MIVTLDMRDVSHLTGLILPAREPISPHLTKAGRPRRFVIPISAHVFEQHVTLIEERLIVHLFSPSRYSIMPVHRTKIITRRILQNAVVTAKFDGINVNHSIES